MALYIESDKTRVLWYQTGHKGQQPGPHTGATETAPTITVTDP